MPDDENYLFDLGLSYIKEHLPDHDEPPLRQTDSSSASDEARTHPGNNNQTTYLACTAGGMDILTSYPAVSSLSLNLNTALPASAACERLFSVTGLIFSPRRGRIDSHKFENQLLLKLNKDFFKFE